MLVHPVVIPGSGTRSWTVLGDDDVPVVPVDRFLAYLTGIGRSPNTVKAYAHDLKNYWEFISFRGLDWRAVRLEDVGEFVAWLRLPTAGPLLLRPALRKRLPGRRGPRLRHEAIAAAEQEVSIVPRKNANGARAKSGARTVPVGPELIRLYADYLHEEYGSIDHVFVNIWTEPKGHAWSYQAACDLVLRVRARTLNADSGSIPGNRPRTQAHQADTNRAQADKARLGDVFYDGVAGGADPLIDQWKRETCFEDKPGEAP